MRADIGWSLATITATRDLTPSIREFTLAPEGGATPYATGSHLAVHLLVEGRPETRHYSLVGDRPEGGAWRIAVKREDQGRGGSRAMWSLPPGARLEVSQPISHFELSPGPGPVLLIAGGIGITPILGMARALAKRGADFSFLYAGRTRAEMAYADALAAEHATRLHLHCDDTNGRLDLAGRLAALPADTDAYVCGPLGLLEAARAAWEQAGRPRARLRFETFGSSGRFAPQGFTVRLPRYDRELRVPEGTSLLDALEQAGIPVLSDCRRGECGLCMVEVLAVEGEIDHRDVFLSDAQHEEGRQLCACVSRIAGASVTIDTFWRGKAA